MLFKAYHKQIIEIWETVFVMNKGVNCGVIRKKIKKEINIVSARSVQNFLTALTFTAGEVGVVDFLLLFAESVKGENLKYFAPERFKKFNVKDRNLYWVRMKMSFSCITFI